MSRAFAYLAAGAAVAVVALPVSMSALGAGYESPPTFSPGRILPPDLLRSPYHSIVGTVPVENFLDRYQMQTKWGTFTVLGTELLRMRVREAAATAKLEEINGAETLVTSAGRTALKPLGTAKDLVTAPGKTIGETFRGVGGWFNRVDASMGATDPNREGTVASLAGGSKARRKLAFDAGVDPYTTFEPLNDQLTRVASASAIGESGVNIGLAFVTGGAGLAISVGGSTSTLREVLRDKTAAELEQLGRTQLVAMGVAPGTIDAFYASPWLTPTDKAVIVAAMMQLGNVSGREIFIARTALAKSYSEGFAYRRKAELTAAYHKRVAPVRAFVAVGGTPLMQTARGTVAIVPMDYVYWTPQVEGLLSSAGPRGELWITGSASALATQNAASRGWTIVPKAGGRLEK
jgi:hypothetical protein